jgi:hypothetical protein
MRNRFFFGAFAVLFVLFLFFMFFTRGGNVQTGSLPKPLLSAPEAPVIASIPPAMYLKATSSPERPAPVAQKPLPVEDVPPAPPDRPTYGGHLDADPGSAIPGPIGATVPAPPDGPSYS